MRGALALLTAVIAVSGIYNAVILSAVGSRGLFVWGLAFGVGVPLLGIAQAWMLARTEPQSSSKLRPSVLILSGILLAQAAMLPLAETLRDRTAVE